MATALLRLQVKRTPFISARLFSSSAAWPLAAPPNSDGESAVYRRALKVQRPTTVRFQENLRNFVSLMGAITMPLKACNTDKFGFYTYLDVKAPSRDNRRFWIQLKFWDEMAEVSVQHLKLHDLVYVSGHLGSYRKLDEDGRPVLYYSVFVKELNFVAQNVPEAYQNIVKTRVAYEENMQKHRNRLHLWQVFFANPTEWWDNRNSKLTPGRPDFRHEDTDEALWIQNNDPPWIKQQLQLLDSRLSKRSDVHRKSAWSQLSPLVID